MIHKSPLWGKGMKEKDGDEGVNQLQGAEVQGAADDGEFLPSFIQQMSVSCFCG